MTIPPWILYGGWKSTRENIGCTVNVLADGDKEGVAQAVCAAIAVCGLGYSCKDAWLSDKKITASPMIKRGWIFDTTASLTARLYSISAGHTKIELSVSAEVSRLDSESHQGMDAFVHRLLGALEQVFQSRGIKAEVMK